MYNRILCIDQYSPLAIRLNIFRFSANNLKTNFKYEKSFAFVCRACQDESIDITTRCTLINIHASLLPSSNIFRFFRPIIRKRI